MTLDESRINDEVFEVDNYKVIMSKGLAFRLSEIFVNFGGFMNKNGFSIIAETNYYEY